MSYNFNRIIRYVAGNIVLHYDKRSDKKRPYLIISNNSAAIDGYSDYIVLPITSKNKRKKKFMIEVDHESCGLKEPSFIKGNKPDVITQDGIIKLIGNVDSVILEQSKEALEDCIKDESMSRYKESFMYWIKAYNVAYRLSYTLSDATNGMKDEFHTSIGRFIFENKSVLKISLNPEYLDILKIRIE